MTQYYPRANKLGPWASAGALTLSERQAAPLTHQLGDGLLVCPDGSTWDPLYAGRAVAAQYSTDAARYEQLVGEFVVQGSLTAAQVRALNTSPRTIIGGVSGFIWVPIWVRLFLDFGTVAYDGIAAGEDLAIRSGDESGPILATIETAGFLDASGDAYRLFLNSGLSAGVGGDDLVWHMLAGNVATGDSPLHYRVGLRLFPATGFNAGGGGQDQL